MNITMKASILGEALNTISRALPSRSTVKAINNIHVNTGEKGLTFSATNLEMAVQVTLACRLDEKSDFYGKSMLVPPRVVEVARHFPSEDVNLSIDWELKSIVLSGETAHFKFHCSDSIDYPEAPFATTEETFVVELDRVLFNHCLKMVLFAASTEESRPAFNGVFMQIGGDTISFTATDTYRLAVKDYISPLSSYEENSFLVPSRTLKEFLRICGDSEGSLSISSYSHSLVFRFNDVYVSTRLLEEKYPQVRAVIPARYLTRLGLERRSFEAAVSRAYLISEGINHAVNLSLEENHLKISVTSSQGKMEEIVPVSLDGSEEISIVFNARYLLEVLRHITEENIYLDFHGYEQPLVVRLPDDANYTYLLLPITSG